MWTKIPLVIWSKFRNSNSFIWMNGKWNGIFPKSLSMKTTEKTFPRNSIQLSRSFKIKMKETGGERREVRFGARSPAHEWMEPVVYSPVHWGKKKSNRWTERSVQCVLLHFSKKSIFFKNVKLKFEKLLSKTCQFGCWQWNFRWNKWQVQPWRKIINWWKYHFLKHSLCSELVAISRIRQNYSADEDVQLAIDGYGAIYPIGRIPEAMGGSTRK